MSIKYKKVKQRVTNAKGQVKEVFFARACQRHKVTLDDVAEHIAGYTSLSRSDVHSVLIALSDTIPDYLLDNNAVELGDLGIFSLHFNSQSEEAEEKVTWRSIQELKIRFRPGKRIKDRLKFPSFKLAK